MLRSKHGNLKELARPGTESSLMLYSAAFYLALTIFILGSGYRVARWLVVRVGPDAGRISAGARLWNAIKGLVSVLFSHRIAPVARALPVNVVLQSHILKKDLWRWLMHFSLSAGFLLLFLMHALDGQITARLFSGYYSTANPYLFLRNLFGAMALFGIVIAACRRAASKRLKRLTTTQDVFALVILAVILLSGFLLEAGKIVSEPIFSQMVADYADLKDPQDIRALQGYWAKYYGVVFSDSSGLSDPKLMARGEELHFENCAACHSRPAAAFVSFPLSRLLVPLAASANSAGIDTILWHIHYLSCFLLLAYLPFSKFAHIFTSSISLMVRRLEEQGPLRPANQVTRRALSLDACMNCGLCSLHCSVEPVHRMLGNPDILPSRKLASLKIFSRNRMTDPDNLSRFDEGSTICTSCYRCTQLCPAGINLQDLWLASRDDLASQGISGPYRRVRNSQDPAPRVSTGAAGADSQTRSRFRSLGFSGDPASFSACIQCGTCTNVCPVVANYQESPLALGFLDLTPQQIVNSFRLGMTARVLNSKMAWDCFTCFKCEEHCPRGIPIAEMIYELRNRAYQETGPRPGCGAAVPTAGG
jgi:heterodisulfide reductase subunit C/nitrate reductase gamma subunit